MRKNSENTNAFLIHISAFAGYLFPFGSIITPLILWQTLKDKSPFLDKHGKEAVNFNISYSIYMLIASASIIPFFMNAVFNLIQIGNVDFGHFVSNFWSFFGWISIVSVLSLVKIAFIILAAIKANNGEIYEYPFTIKFIK